LAFYADRTNDCACCPRRPLSCFDACRDSDKNDPLDRCRGYGAFFLRAKERRENLRHPRVESCRDLAEAIIAIRESEQLQHGNSYGPVLSTQVGNKYCGDVSDFLLRL
jgi:hypothetical protein